jgi:hypothetical protein
MVLFRLYENLRFVLEAAKSLAMQNSVPITLKLRSNRVKVLWQKPPTSVSAELCIGPQVPCFKLLVCKSNSVVCVVE